MFLIWRNPIRITACYIEVTFILLPKYALLAIFTRRALKDGYWLTTSAIALRLMSGLSAAFLTFNATAGNVGKTNVSL